MTRFDEMPAQPDEVLLYTPGYSDLDSFCISNMWDFDFPIDTFLAPEAFPESELESFPADSVSSDLQEPRSIETHRRKRAKTDKDDDFYLRHYEKCIGSWAYSLKEDVKTNYLRFILDFLRGSNCPSNSPFRLAVLAWTAKHWQMTSDANDETWKLYYDGAMEELQNDTVSQSAIMSSKGDMVICSTLFLCRCDVLNDDIASIRTHLNGLKDHLDVYLSGGISAFASQMLLWLGYLHVRISIFSSATPPGTIATTLLDAIAAHVDYKHICARSQHWVDEAFGSSYSEEERRQEAERGPVTQPTHETFRLIANMLHFRSWSNLDNSADKQELASAKAAAIDLDIRRIEAEFALVMATDPAAAALRSGATGASESTASLKWLSCYAVFLTARILWSRIHHPDVRSEEPAAEAVRAIMNVALCLRKTHRLRTASLKIPRTMLWPLPLFMAGIETTDEIYADWTRTFMDEVSSSGSRGAQDRHANGGWISSVSGGKRVQVLMARVREMQDALGRRVDVASIMNDMNGGGAFVL